MADYLVGCLTYPFVIPALRRGPASSGWRDEAGCRIKSGMTGDRSTPIGHRR
jgi:hypothetical protein